MGEGDNRKVMSEEIERYDAIVIGSAIGGLFTASLMAKKNLSVLILKEKAYKPIVSRGGYRFIPFSNFSEINLNKALIEWIFEELDIPLKPIGKNSSNDSKDEAVVHYQVLLPDNRIDVADDASLFRVELEREFRNELGEIKRFFDELRNIRDLIKNLKSKDVSPNLFPARRPNLLGKFISSFFKRKSIGKRLSVFSKEFQKFIEAQLIANGNLYPKEPSIYLAAYNLMKRLGDIDKTIDIDRLYSQIIDRFSSMDGRIQEVERIDKIERRFKDRFIISLDGGERVLESRFIIINHPFKNISYIQDGERVLLKGNKLIKPYYTIMPVFLGIKEKVVPVGMKDLFVSIFDINKPYEKGNLIYIYLSPAGDEFWSPRGKRALLVEALIPYKDLCFSDETFKKNLFSHLNHIIPFLEEYVEFVDFEWGEKQLSCWSYPHFIYKEERGFDWRAGIISHKISKNIFFVGKENFPYLGLEGEIISAYLIVRDILGLN